MSAHDIHAGHDDHHDHDDMHVSMSDYVKGFILAVILTVIPFYLVMSGAIQDRTTGIIVLGAFAIVQVVVHMVYFLHMNGKIQGGWTMLSTIFTAVFLAIAMAGTVWVMYQMNLHMMPGHSDHAPVPAAAVEPIAAPVAVPAAEVVAPAASAPAAEVAPAADAPAVEAVPAVDAAAAQAQSAAHGAHGSN